MFNNTCKYRTLATRRNPLAVFFYSQLTPTNTCRCVSAIILSWLHKKTSPV